ncbi:hypothetical protein Clacol_008377 [Clathrus columnatus]|uniref:Small monomeric GTPase n=1 Tax=Clathrus columnatus TaxID=1419009 RepID=A0AAV5AMP9_9AGAM|nr:hypothetical protein Clacol_008377 [Clathrus columnatus]
MSENNQFYRQYKLIVLGDGGVGKSALTIQFLRSHFVDDYDPTIEDSYVKHSVVDGEKAVLEILDTAGQEQYLQVHFYYFYYLFLILDGQGSFSEVDHIIQQILRVKDVTSFPMVLVGNKCDLEYNREVGRDEGRKLGQTFNCPAIETSAKERINVDEAFHALVRQVRIFNKEQQNNRRTMFHPLAGPQANDGQQNNQDNSSPGCCGCVIA